MACNFTRGTRFIRRFAAILLGMTLAASAFAVDAEEGQRILDTYTAADQLAQPRLESIRPFTGTVKEEPLPKSVADIVTKFSGLTTKAYDVDGIHICETYYSKGKKKKNNAGKQPLLIFLHGGGANRAYFFERGENEKKQYGKATFYEYAKAGLRIVTLDAPGLGDSDAGPIDSLSCYAETVHYIDRIIEYYNTIGDVDATRFALQGFSMGGCTALAYVTHGSYKPVAVVSDAGCPDFSSLGDDPLYDCFDQGKFHMPAIMTKEQVLSFAKRYSPINWPEKFKDVYVLAGNGLDDEFNPAESMRTLEAKLKELGYTDFHFEFVSKYGHWHIEYIRQNALTMLKKKLLN